MKNKSLYTFLLTALLAVSACVMQARADMIYNASESVNISSIPSSDYFKVADFPISLSVAKKNNQSFSFSMRLVDQKDDAHQLVFLQDLKLSNADEIDASILRRNNNFGDEENSVYSDFTPIAEGTVTLKYEGDIIVKKGDKGTWSWLNWSYSGGSADVTRHITVDEVVTVTE